MGLNQDSYELTKLQLDLAEFKHECEALLRTFTHSGCTLAKQHTTVTGDRTDNNTTILSDYGRIQTPDGREIYFHRNSVVNSDFDQLEPGLEVRFSEEPGDEGPQATSVQLIGKHHLAS